jgi:hypothetical protein
VELNIVNEVAALERLSIGQLQQRFAELFGETTKASNCIWLVKRILWRMQALAEGDLPERARRRAAELARDADLRLNPPQNNRHRLPRADRRLLDLFVQEGGNYAAVARRLGRGPESVRRRFHGLFRRIWASMVWTDGVNGTHLTDGVNGTHFDLHSCLHLVRTIRAQAPRDRLPAALFWGSRCHRCFGWVGYPIGVAAEAPAAFIWERSVKRRGDGR